MTKYRIYMVDDDMKPVHSIQYLPAMALKHLAAVETSRMLLTKNIEPVTTK